MDNTSVLTSIAREPVGEVLSIVLHELRVPLVSMRAALEVIEQYSAAPELRAIVPPILVHVHLLFDHLEQFIMDLRALAVPRADAHPMDGVQRTRVEQAVAVLQTAIPQLHADTLLLDQQSVPLRATATATLTEPTQQFVTMFLTQQERWTRDMRAMLPALLTRLEQAAQE